MPDANEFKAALERLIAGAGTDSDVSALRAAHSTGVLVTGDRAVALGGNATDVSIASGDQIVFSIKGGDAATVLAALNSVTPARRHQVSPPPADFTGRADEQASCLRQSSRVASRSRVCKAWAVEPKALRSAA
jgi:hypothetical protein